jgi:Sulfatase
VDRGVDAMQKLEPVVHVRPGVENSPIEPAVGFWRAALHLGGLWALAFVQPLFGLLGDSAEFFVARGNTTFDIVVFALGYGLVPPLLGAGAVWGAERIRRGLGWALHLTLIALLTAALVLPPLGDALSGSAAAVAVALPIGVGAAFLYMRTAGVRAFLTVLSPAPLVFVVLFLGFSPVSDLVMPGEASGSVAGPVRSSTPIVHIVLDELPVTTLTGADGGIDAALFPNLARLAAGATWYRNATTVADTTSEAVPALVTGERPEVGALPTSTHHPRSLFTLFRRSHELSVVEPITDVCPARLCPEPRPSVRARLSALADDLTIVTEHLLLPDDLRKGLPAIDRGWLGFDSDTDGIAARGSRAKLLGRVIERLRADDAGIDFARVTAVLDRESARPPLIFMHSTLPHGPARFLPDGRGYPINRNSHPGLESGRWTHRQWLADHNFQRHVLQTQYADALVGRLLGKLRAAGLYDDAVIVVTADHGVSFRAGQARRRLARQTMADLVVIPFIVKLPGQRDGRVDDGAVRTVDALPTIAKAAGVRVPWRTDGVPADERSVDPGTAIDVTDDGKPGVPRSLGTILDGLREREAVEARLLRDGLYAIGPRPDLIGRRVGGDGPAAAGPRATVDSPGAYRAIAAGAAALPALVSGDVRGLDDDAVIAVAVNGRIEATTRVFPDGSHGQYTAMVRPASLHAGSNTIAVLEVLPGGRLRRIG